MISVAQIPGVVQDFYHAQLGTVVFRSAPGIGKTAQVRAAAKIIADGRPFGFIEEHLATRSEVDLRGYLIPSDGQATYTKPDFWRTVEAYDRGILFLDELFQCSAEMQKAIAPLLLDKRIGDYTLPDGWIVVGATNGAEHRSGVVPALSHVTNRICLMDVSPPTPQELASYYTNAGMPIEIMALTMKSPATVLQSTPSAQGVPFCTPRSLESAGRCLVAFGGAQEGFRSLSCTAMVEGFIGKAACIELSAMAGLIHELPTLDEILAMPTVCRIPDTVDKQWLMSSMLGARVSEHEFQRAFTYIERMPSNIAFLMVYGCWRRGLTGSGQSFIDWTITNQDLLRSVRVQ